MKEERIKKQLLELIETFIGEEEVLPMEFMTDGIPDASTMYQHFLARYHVRRAAETIMDMHSGRFVDPKLEEEIRARIDDALMAQPDCIINRDCLPHGQG